MCVHARIYAGACVRACIAARREDHEPELSILPPSSLSLFRARSLSFFLSRSLSLSRDLSHKPERRGLLELALVRGTGCGDGEQGQVWERMRG